MNIVVIVQARKGSTRFPGKILMPVLGKTLLEHQIERIISAKSPNKVVIATTTLIEDNDIENICINNNYLIYRGHPTDLLDRHYKTALAFGADIVVKIPSDCPLIDPKIIDKVINFYLENIDHYDFVSNLHPPTYPDGNDVEVIPMNILHSAWNEAEKNYELEHTTPFIWDNPTRFKIGNVFWETGLNYSMTHRFTIDYFEDYRFIKSVYEELYPLNPLFGLEDILDLLAQKPEILKLNKIYTGVNWYRHHLSNLKTIDLNMTKVI
ncbi:MAG: glycosyltransferase family protein [FCB group bacterium]|jgi:spore coat polysaccharide biosynthesis protein SpsF